jgi:D-alanyl-D-alanine carboxypeptidase (penicillin-binding protein 5/6)
MTKIMTSYVVADQISNGLISFEDQVLISEKAWRMGGSKMFIEAGKKVSISDLLKGVIIQSGNDASVAISEYAGGTERGFVDLMNAYADSLGMNNTIFQNSTGLPDENHFSSAKDLATLTSNFIIKFPDIYSLYKEKQFTFNNIKQLNRNKLLWRDESSDGVKTGHTEAAGYCLVGSAKRGDMRLITVVAGSDTDNNRFLASQRLLEYGFRFFATQKVLNANEEYKNIKIWGGVEQSLGIGVLEDVSITLPRTSFKDLTVNYNYSNNIQAPINVGQKIGTIEIISNEEVVFSTELVALKEIKSKGFFGRLWSKFVLWVYGLFGMTENGNN